MRGRLGLARSAEHLVEVGLTLEHLGHRAREHRVQVRKARRSLGRIHASTQVVKATSGGHIYEVGSLQTSDYPRLGDFARGPNNAIKSPRGSKGTL